MTADLTAKQARERLGIRWVSQFWKLVHARRVPYMRYTSRLVRFDPIVIEQLRASVTVKSAEDIRRLTDGRRRS